MIVIHPQRFLQLNPNDDFIHLCWFFLNTFHTLTPPCSPQSLSLRLFCLSDSTADTATNMNILEWKKKRKKIRKTFWRGDLKVIFSRYWDDEDVFHFLSVFFLFPIVVIVLLVLSSSLSFIFHHPSLSLMMLFDKYILEKGKRRRRSWGGSDRITKWV